MIHDYFPYGNYRIGQHDTLDSLEEVLEDNDYEYIILDAPTGFGKSSIAFTLANWLKDCFDEKSYILTATKQLQSQYLDEVRRLGFHADYKVAMGRSNYECRMMADTCDYGRCRTSLATQKFRCPYGLIDGTLTGGCGGCAYWQAKYECAMSDVAIMNYDVLMVDNLFVNHYFDRDFMICDEAHNIEDKIMNHVAITLSDLSLKKIGVSLEEESFKQEDIEYWIDYIRGLINICYQRESSANFHGLNIHELQKISAFRESLQWKVKELEKHESYWIVNADPFTRRIEIKPIKVSKYANDLLLDSARRKMFMSGSFIDYEQFCHDLGIDVDEAYHYRAESGFDMKNHNPIHRRLAGSMSYKSKARTLPNTVPILHSIFNEHEGEKGLIHCNSREFARYIMDNVNNPRLMTYSSQDKEDKLRLFENSSNLIMVSYSMTEGVDLPYDGIRFQVFYKIPYMSLADNQVKRRLELEPNWYNVKTMQTLLQAWGRGMRAEDDYCTNYVIDSSINRILHDKAFEHLVPEEFREAIT